MPADPRPGQRYRQECLRGAAEDDGEVLAVGQQVEVPAGHYRKAVLTRDTTRLEPDVTEYKLYAPGVGLVLTVDVSGGSGREELIRVDGRVRGRAPARWGIRTPDRRRRGTLRVVRSWSSRTSRSSPGCCAGG